jgi:SAM-dependent methyltransferase
MSDSVVANHSRCPACASANHQPSWLGEGRFRDFEFAYRGCGACGSLFVDPLPDEALVAAMYSPEYIDQHYGEGDASAEIGGELDDTARAAAERRPHGRLLDVGCGAGRFMIAARDAGLCVEGQELLASVAKLAADATGLPVHSGTLDTIRDRYDLVHLADVVEHVTDPFALLVAARARLAPDGVVIARGPLEQQPNLFQQAVRWQRAARTRLGRARPIEMPPWHISQFTLRGWHVLIARAGLRTIDEQIYETRWPAPDAFSLRPRALVKSVSQTVSASPVGRALRLGNRIVSWLAAASG